MSVAYKISASILAADFSRLGEQIHEAELAGVDWIHVDVMDGHFVPNLTMGPVIVKACRNISQLPLDIHLMVEAPENFVECLCSCWIYDSKCSCGEQSSPGRNCAIHS